MNYFMISVFLYITILNFVLSAPVTDESTIESSTEFDRAVTKRHVLRQAPANHRPIINFFTHHNNNGMRPGLFGHFGNQNAMQGVNTMQQQGGHRPFIFRPFANFGNHNNMMASNAMTVPLDPISAERISTPFIMYPGYVPAMPDVTGMNMGSLAALAPTSAPIAVYASRNDGITDFPQQGNFYGNSNYFTGGLIPDESFGFTGFPNY